MKRLLRFSIVALAACASGTDPHGPPEQLTALPRTLSADEQRVSEASNQFALTLFKHGKVPLIPHVAKDVQEARALYELVKSQGRDGAAGIVQGERALARLDHGQGAHGEEAE